MNIGKKIKERREELGLTQQELADKMGYTSRSAICKVESGENDITQSKIIQYAKHLNISPLWLLGLTDDKTSFSITNCINKTK